MKICSSCHSLIEDDAVTCPNCGAEQRHFPNSKPAKPRPKRSHAALKLILPAALVVVQMGAILAFALRESDDPSAETNVETTTTTNTEVPREGDLRYNFFTCPNGNGRFIYFPNEAKLTLLGDGTLSTTVYPSSGTDWTVYLETVKIIEIEGFEEIEADTFRGAPNLENVSITPRRTDLSIGEYAFADCKKLRRFIIEDTDPSGEPTDKWLVQLGDGCFSGCSALTGLYLLSVSKIGKNVFDGVDNLIDFQVSPELIRFDSTLSECYGIILFMKEGEAVDREIFEKLRAIHPTMSVHIDGKLLADLDQCPLKEE